MDRGRYDCGDVGCVHAGETGGVRPRASRVARSAPQSALAIWPILPVGGGAADDEYRDDNFKRESDMVMVIVMVAVTVMMIVMVRVAMMVMVTLVVRRASLHTPNSRCALSLSFLCLRPRTST